MVCSNKSKLFRKVTFVTGITLANGAMDLILILSYVGIIQHQLGRDHYRTVGAYEVFHQEVIGNMFKIRIVLMLFMLAAASFLSYGVKKGRRFNLLPWMICVVVMTIINGLSLKDSLKFFGMTTMNVVRMGGYLVLLNLNLFCVWLIIAYYKELERNETRNSQVSNGDEFCHDSLQGVFSDDLEMTPATIIPPIPGTSITIIANNTSPPATTLLQPPDYESVIAQDEMNRQGQLSINTSLVPPRQNVPDRSPPPPYSEVAPDFALPSSNRAEHSEVVSML